jgi:hypothetical protein
MVAVIVAAAALAGVTGLVVFLVWEEIRALDRGEE